MPKSNPKAQNTPHQPAANFVISGGGTGGHLFPGLAVMRQLIKAKPSLQPIFVGVKQGIEARIIPKLGYPIYYLPITGAYRSSLINKLSLAFRLPYSLWQALGLIIKLKPKFILGLGGYGSLPMVVAGLVLAKPVFILEQNLAPGIVNRYLGKFAKAFFAAQDLEQFKWPNIQTLGYPIREDIDQLAASPIKMPAKFRLLVFGGSQGARVLNQLLVNSLADLKKLQPAISIVHQTGAADLDKVQKAAMDSGLDYQVSAFIDDMKSEYQQCSLVLCRCGAGIFELTAAAKAAILVPIANSSADHQQKNCDFFVKNKAAWGLNQHNLKPQQLVAIIKECLKDPQILTSKAKQMRKLHQPQAAQNIANYIIEHS